MQCEGCQVPIWKAGDLVPAGVYVRIDDESYRKITLHQAGPLPASFDGHVALYRVAASVYKTQIQLRELTAAVNGAKS